MEAIDWAYNGVNIIVLGYGLPKIESECLASIIEHTKYPYQITFIDNKETGLTLTQAWNKLISNTLENNVCLLNSDTVVTSGWLSRMMETLDSDDSVGFVGPSTNNCHSPQKTITFDKAHKMPRTEEIMKDPISGFCLLFKTYLWKKLNGFDARYKFYGQESDFIDRAKERFNYNCVWRKDAFVWHIGEASVKVSDMNVTKERDAAKKLYWKDRGK